MVFVDMNKLYQLQGNMSEIEFAKKLSISRSQLWRIKNDKAAIGIDFVEGFMKAYPEANFNTYFFTSDVALTKHKSDDDTEGDDSVRKEVGQGGEQ